MGVKNLPPAVRVTTEVGVEFYKLLVLTSFNLLFL
jgi:hypothetical protein